MSYAVFRFVLSVGLADPEKQKEELGLGSKELKAGKSNSKQD